MDAVERWRALAAVHKSGPIYHQGSRWRLTGVAAPEKRCNFLQLEITNLAAYLEEFELRAAETKKEMFFVRSCDNVQLYIKVPNIPPFQTWRIVKFRSSILL